MISLDQQSAAPPPPPETNVANETKTEESIGVNQMFDTNVNDVEKENQVMKLEEEEAPEGFESSWLVQRISGRRIPSP